MGLVVARGLSAAWMFREDGEGGGGEGGCWKDSRPPVSHSSDTVTVVKVVLPNCQLPSVGR